MKLRFLEKLYFETQRLYGTSHPSTRQRLYEWAREFDRQNAAA